MKDGHPTCDLLTHSEIQDAVDQVNAEQQRANATAIPEQAIVNFQVRITDGVATESLRLDLNLYEHTRSFGGRNGSEASTGAMYH